MSDILRRHGGKPAVTMAGSGRTRSFAELDERSIRLARVFADAGLERGDHVAVLLDNDLAYFDAAWAALRSGLYLTPINWHLGVDETGYIVQDCEAKALVTSATMADVVAELGGYAANVSVRLSVGGGIDGYDDFEAAIAAASPEPRAEEYEGALMLYSSGTTGRPKGIVPRLPEVAFGVPHAGVAAMASKGYGIDETSVYLSPAPLYHSAPIGWSLGAQRLGASTVVMERFDAAGALRAIQDHQVTHAQFVPTHFIRMLRLDEDERASFDVSSLQKVIHAAAPCPVPVKQQMIDWLGPIVDEYYGGSEAIGLCAIGGEEWLAHPGSVGRSILGEVHILDPDGNELGPGETGQVWFSTRTRFEYHGDPEKTAKSQDPRGWATYGDVGHVDQDGYVFLTDRASNMIISGGVNIYPQEAENVLTVHPDVSDVAVIGVPDAEMGERVKAFVVPAVPVEDEAAFAAALIAHCRDTIAHYKCPRDVALVGSLPRMDSGKLVKRLLLES